MLEQFELASLDARVHLLWAVVALGAVAVWAARRRAAALEQFGVEPGAARRVARRRLIRGLLCGAGLVALLFAALRPRANPEEQLVTRQARDLAICLDVSRSMLADDLRPTRLEHATLELTRLADHLSHERVGLILFAGEAVVRCPLTSNYSYFKSALQDVGPRSVSQGGTHIGDAIRKALVDLLGHDLSGRSRSEDGAEGEPPADDEPSAAELDLASFQDVLVITDGEDHESYPVHAARLARELGVGVFAVGLGSAEGRLIPLQDGGYLEHQGSPVRSKLDESLLTEMVSAAGRGRYLPVGTQHFDLVDFYERSIRQEDGRAIEEELLVWTEVYQPFLILGLALLLAGWAVPLGRAPVRLGAPSSARLAPVGGAALALLAWAPAAHAQETPLERGNAAFAQEHYAEAAAAYEQEESEGRLSLLCRFNAGVARRALGELDQAIAHLEHVAVRADRELQRSATYLLGTCRFEKGQALRQSPPAEETAEDALKRLAQAALELRAAVDFFQRVSPPSERAEEATRVAKVRLRECLNELAQRAEEQAEQAERDALADPARFLLETLRAVRERRRALAALGEVSIRRRRVGCRRIAKAEEETRELLEKLKFGLENPVDPPASQPTQPGRPAPQDEAAREAEEQRRQQGAQALGVAIEASRRVEGAVRGLDPAPAVPSASTMIEGLRLALLLHPLDIAALTGELVQHQRQVSGGVEDERLIPKEQEEVAFLCQAFQAVQAQPAPQAPPGAGPAPPGLDEETAAQIRDKGLQAHEAGLRAYEHLREGRRAEAKDPAATCLLLLEEIQELLPKPPPSLQERIEELLAQEQEARAQTDALQGLSGESLEAEAQRLVGEQQTHRGRAEALAGEAQQQPSEQTQAAAEHLQQAAQALSGAADALAQTQRAPALDAADRAIESLEQALEALKGEQGDQGQQNQQQQQQQQQQDQQEQQEQQGEAQRLDPEEARRLMEEQDDERRKEEARLFPGGSGRAVEKDW